MDNIPVKLLQKEPAYNFFENNQVLTADQLNDMIRHMDYEDRLTRVRLLGAGIVCGLRIFFARTGIVITKGTGVTSDGDLISLDSDLTLTTVVPLVDKKASYSFFKGLNTGNVTKLWEALPSTASDSDAVPFGNLFTGNITPGNFVVLLYLEQFLEDLDDCTSDDCDHKGIAQKSNLKVLLVAKDAYDKLKKENICCSDAYYDLPDVSVRRVVFNPAGNVFSYRDITTGYRNAILDASEQLLKVLPKADQAAQPLFDCFMKNGNFPENFRSNLTGTLRAAISIRVLNSSSLGSSGSEFETKIKPFRDNQNPIPGIQYVYDFVKDVSEAYYEFREALYDVCQSCCLPADQFPKHLALGLLEGNEATEPCHYRQCFIESPILNSKDEELLRVLTLYNRLVGMIHFFKFDIDGRDAIKITPSAAVSKSITEKAIPYYYTPGTIHQYWDPEKTKRLKADTNLSYNSDVYSDRNFVVTPLNFDLDKYDFFRIEGHIGKKYEDVYTQLDSLRKQQDLPFDVIGLQLQLDRRTIIPRKPPVHSHLDMFVEANKFHFADYLDKLSSYQTALVKKLPDPGEMKTEEVTDHYGNPNNLRNGVVTGKANMDSHIQTAKRILSKPIEETLDDEHTMVMMNMIKEGPAVHAGAKVFTRQMMTMPLEHMTATVSPQILDWIKGIKIDIQNKVADGYVFLNFLKEHPSLLHNAGVCKGGTFVLLYENSDDKKTVVADFYLPYIMAEEPNKPPVLTPAVPLRPFLPFDDWVIKDFEQPPLRNVDVLKLKENYIKDIGEIRTGVNKLKDDTNVIINGLTKKVDNVKDDVSDKFVKAVDNYQGSFDKIVTSYQSVLTKAASGAAATGVTAETGRFTEVVNSRLTAFKLDDVDTETEAKTLKANMEKTIAAMKRKFPNI